jgi:hypothetical protein
LTGLIVLQTKRSSSGCVTDEHRRCLGFVSTDQLRDVLLTQERRREAKIESLPHADRGHHKLIL